MAKQRDRNRQHSGKRPSGAPQILRLWPTHLLRHRLPGADAANAALEDFIIVQEQRREGFTTGYLDQDFFAADHPAVEWLAQCVNRAVGDYVRETAVDYDFDWSIQGWANLNRFGDYHNLHNHPHCWLSGTYYVAVPTEDRAPPGRDDRNAGAISFFDPRGQANMNAIKGDPQIDPEFRVVPKAGEIMLWPAFLHHLVHPNLSDRPRISVSFNIVVKGGYLP